MLKEYGLFTALYKHVTVAFMYHEEGGVNPHLIQGALLARIKLYLQNFTTTLIKTVTSCF